MATLQKIRSKGVFLIAIVGLALFAFIAEELVRAMSSTQNSERQKVAEICGESVSYQEFNDMFSEYENAVKLGNGGQSLNEAQNTQLRDQAWNEFVSYSVIANEAKKLGLTVTDAEMQSIINNGTSPLLRQTPFVSQQTGAFDANQLKQFLSNYQQYKDNPEYAQGIEGMKAYYDYWKFIEKQIRQQTLVQKYQALLTTSLLTNPASAKAAYDARTNESTALVAALPFTSIQDNEIEVSDSELKAKFEELKKQYPNDFYMSQETRDIKYIAVSVTASADDEQALRTEMEEYGKALAENTENIANTVRESRSLVAYNGLAVKRSSLPTDIASHVDSLAPGAQVGPYLNAADNTMNIVKYIARVNQPDSVEFRRIMVAGVDDKAKTTADSIMTALNAGAEMDSIAKKYNQSAEKTWLTSEQVDRSALRDEDRNYIESLFNAATNSYIKTEGTGGIIISQVTDRRNFIDKFNVAVIKRTIDFSDETHNNVWNKFSSFLAANTTVEDIEANAAKAGYTVMPTMGMSSSIHRIANIQSTTDALRWSFNKNTKIGDVSELYECGENNDVLLVVMLTGVHDKGYMTIDDSEISSYIKQQVINDKKAAKLQEKVANAKSIADVAKIHGAVTDTLSHITFASPTYVMKTSSSEAALSGAVSATAKGKFVAGVRGNGGVYAFQVLDKQQNTAEKYDKQAEENNVINNYMRGMNSFMNILMKDAEIVDNRYQFYQ